MGFEPIDPSPQADKLPSQTGVGAVGRVAGEHGIDRRMEASRVVKINRSIVEYSNHRMTSPHDTKWFVGARARSRQTRPTQTGGSV